MRAVHDAVQDGIGQRGLIQPGVPRRHRQLAGDERRARAHPARWSGATRNWSLIDVVALNPERDEVVKMAAFVQHTQLKAA